MWHAGGMVAVEHEEDWTRDAAELEDDVRDAFGALTEIVRAAPEGAIRAGGVRARFDRCGVLEFHLPLASGDAFWIYLGDSWTRLVWVCGADERSNVEWVWDERWSAAFVAAVVAGRVTRRVTVSVGRPRRRRRHEFERWYWTGADGIERTMPPGR